MRAIWNEVQLSELCDVIQYGYTATASSEPIGPQFLRITDIVPDHLSWATVPYCEIEPAKLAKYELASGDIVVARTGATVGYAKYLESPPSAVFASYLVRLRIRRDHDSRFIGKLVESDAYKLFIKAHAGGAAQPNANAKVLTSFPVPLPPLSVQRKIAAVLAAYDELIENNLRRIEILEEMAQAVYREWFDEFRFPGHENVALVDSALGPIPEGWETVVLSDVTETQYGYTASTETSPVGPRFLRGMDFNKRSWIDWSEVPYCPIPDNVYPKYKLRKGDVLVIRMADPGKVAIVEREVEAVFASYVVRVTPQQGRLLPYWLFYYMASPDYQGYMTGTSTGTTRRSASAGVLTGSRLPLPPLSIQGEFVGVVGLLRRLLNNLVEQNANLRATRDLLLPRLVSGELDVSEMDIDTEWLAS